MKVKLLISLVGLLMLLACQESVDEFSEFTLISATIGDQDIPLDRSVLQGAAMDRPITLEFSSPLNPSSIANGIALTSDDQDISFDFNLFSGGRLLSISPATALSSGTTFNLVILNSLKDASGRNSRDYSLFFATNSAPVTLSNIEFIDAEILNSGRITQVSLSPEIILEFSEPIVESTLINSLSIEGLDGYTWTLEKIGDQAYKLKLNQRLHHFSRYNLVINAQLEGARGGDFSERKVLFYTGPTDTPVFPQIGDDALLELVQRQTFKYFWDFGHENSGMARERNTSGNLVTTGGSGFGAMAMIVGVERGFISRDQAIERWEKMINFLEKAERFRGAWPHWLNGNTGVTIPFSTLDDGADLVETALLLQGLLTVRSYLSSEVSVENELKERILQLFEEVEWDWFTREQNELYWHWSPNHNWGMNLRIQGYNESLITFILGAASTNYPIAEEVYTKGWSRNGAMVNGANYFGIRLPLGKELGGPLFFAHYSFLGIDPRNMSDQFGNYWEQNVNHTKINRAHVIANPRGFVGYSIENWGLTASDNETGYFAHCPINDRGVITPTAALSSIPYTPKESMDALRFFYYQLGDRLWGEYGFHDAFNLTEDWFASSYLAIDQGPIILMIENHRSGLLWDLMGKNEIFERGLNKLNFKF